MRILVGIPCLLTGGTEIQTLSLVEALVAAGHRPLVVCYFEHNEGMVKRYEDAGAEVRLLSADGKRPAGIKAVVAHLWKGLRGAVKEFRPEVAHVQYMAPGALPILILRALGVKKIVATSHTAGDIYSRKGLRVIKLLTNHVLSGFQCITERAERSYFGTSKLFDGTRGKHFTIYNNIPSHISILKNPRRAKDAGEDITVGVVSRLEPIKGMDLVVPAFAEVYQRNPRLRLIVVGDGSQRELMERQVKEAGIGNVTEFVGRKAQSELQDCYDSIDILLMPSRSEGFGLTAIEGMARGCVVVAANTGGLPEVVQNGVTGLLHEPDSVIDLAEKITELSIDNNLLNTFSQTTLSRAIEFSDETYKTQISTLYNTLTK